jgi:hypothetical protein
MGMADHVEELNGLKNLPYCVGHLWQNLMLQQV